MTRKCEYCSSTISDSEEIKVGNSYYHLSCAISYINKLKKQNQNFLLKLPNVIGIGIGWRHNKRLGFDKKEICIVVNVNKKVPEAQLLSNQLIPKWINDVKTDVLETFEIVAPRPIEEAVDLRKGRMRPAKGGVSIGHIKITAGTLGCLVRKEKESLILSNNHVLANENDANHEDPILQPGPIDGGKDPEDRIAYLENFIPIHFGYNMNYVDAAVAKPISEDLVSNEVLEIGKPTGVIEPTLGLKVIKSGRTTGLTHGEIVQVATTQRVRYRKGVALFDDQIVIHPGSFSKGGDSGSAIFVDDNTRRICGLLFAGSARVTVANPISNVLNTLGVSLP